MKCSIFYCFSASLLEHKYIVNSPANKSSVGLIVNLYKTLGDPLPTVFIRHCWKSPTKITMKSVLIPTKIERKRNWPENKKELPKYLLLYSWSAGYNYCNYKIILIQRISENRMPWNQTTLRIIKNAKVVIKRQ